MKPLFLLLGWILIALAGAMAVAMHRGAGRTQGLRAWALLIAVYGLTIGGVVLLGQGVDALP